MGIVWIGSNEKNVSAFLQTVRMWRNSPGSPGTPAIATDPSHFSEDNPVSTSRLS
jgi:hypothetical protein